MVNEVFLALAANHPPIIWQEVRLDLQAIERLKFIFMTDANYKNYFKSHVHAEFTRDWVIKDSQFVYNQLKQVDRVLPIDQFRNLPTLEIGAGLGRLYYLLNERGFKRYKGIELDQDAVTFAIQTFGPYFEHKSLADYLKDPFEKVSSVFCFEVLEHLHHPMEALAQISKLLVKDGVFIGTTPFPYKKNIVSDQSHLFVLHPENWRRLFELNNMKVVSIVPMTFLPFLWRLHRRCNIILPFYFPFLKLVSTSLIIARKVQV